MWGAWVSVPLLTSGKIRIDSLKPQHGLRRVGTCHPQEAKVSAAGWVVGPSLVADEDDLMSRICKEREQTLPLNVKAVRGSADLGRPKEAELTWEEQMPRGSKQSVGAGRQSAGVGRQSAGAGRQRREGRRGVEDEALASVKQTRPL